MTDAALKKVIRLEPLRRSIEDSVSDLIERISAIRINAMSQNEAARDYERALSYLMGCDFHFINDLAEEMQGHSRFYLMDDDIPEISWPIDIGGVSYIDDDATLQFNRMWTAEPSSMRGQVKFLPSRIAWLASAQFDKERWFANMTPLGLINGKWRALDAGMTTTSRHSNHGIMESSVRNDRNYHDEVDRVACLMQSAALTARYDWHVALGLASGPRILLPTSPGGCLALFRNREKRDDETRRAALRHWVQNHYRERGEREIAYVRDHLRGATGFSWRGLDAEIFVSQFDLEKNEFFRLQAAQWRSQRKHNRVTVRIKRG
jgi:hypothetical protein